VTKKFLRYILKRSLVFEVYGKDAWAEAHAAKRGGKKKEKKEEVGFDIERVYKPLRCIYTDMLLIRVGCLM
jgi:hypothetical protein